MNDGLISRRYAKALLEFAEERGEDKMLYERMKLLARNTVVVPRVREAFQSPVVEYEDKLNLVHTACGGGPMEESFKSFVQMVVKNQREELLQSLAFSYIALYRRIHRIGKVVVVSASLLPDATLEKLRLEVAKRTRGTIEIESRIDPKLGGGFVLQIDDFRLDASVEGQLEKVRKQFIHRNKIIV